MTRTSWITVSLLVIAAALGVADPVVGACGGRAVGQQAVARRLARDDAIAFAARLPFGTSRVRGRLSGVDGG